MSVVVIIFFPFFEYVWSVFFILEFSKVRSVSNHSTSSSNQRNYNGSNNSISNIEKKSITPNSENKIPLYSNIEYYPFSQNHAEIFALQQYMVEQAKSLGI